MAEALYNHFTHSHDADSAGINAETPGVTLGERQHQLGKSNTVILMQTEGFDISKNKQTQLIKSMLADYDKVISMCDENIAPDWLLSDPNYVYWDIKDPVGAEMPFFRETMEKIKKNVLQLIES